jgi:hypothetical protein
MSIKELQEEEIFAIMQSDMKLWEQSTTTHEGNAIVKQLILPFAIGEFTVRFEGVDNGIKRRAAAEQWGAMVRERIKDRIDDESVTARAQQAAAIRESEDQPEALGEADNGHRTGGGTVSGESSVTAVQAFSTEEAVQAHVQSAEDDRGPAGTDFVARAEWLRGRISEGERKIKAQRRELKALEAALSVLEGEDE